MLTTVEVLKELVEHRRGEHRVASKGLNPRYLVVLLVMVISRWSQRINPNWSTRGSSKEHKPFVRY